MVSHFAPSHQQSFSWKSIPGFRELYWLIRLRAPGQLIIQYTDKCNAACPQCNMRVSAPFERSKLSIDGVKRIIDHAAAQGVAALSITGGEPLLYPRMSVPYRASNTSFVRNTIERLLAEHPHLDEEALFAGDISRKDAFSFNLFPDYAPFSAKVRRR
jgi:hypothetical protein